MKNVYKMGNAFENAVNIESKTDLVCGGESRLGMCAGERKAACLPMRVDPTSFHSPSAACHTSYTVHRYMENSYCKPPFDTAACFLDDFPVVAEFGVEFDASYGPYLHCNPTPMGHGLVNLSNFLCAYQQPGGNQWRSVNHASPPPPSPTHI